MTEIPENVLNFQILTESNFHKVMNLKVSPIQQNFVAPNSVSIAEAHFSDYAWMRGIYYGDIPVGFIMLADPISGEEGEDSKFNGRYFLWRLMIAEDHQGKGFGRKALDLLCEYVHGRPNSRFLYSSYAPGNGGPEQFYLHYGFKKTGEVIEDEVEIILDLNH